MILFEMIIKPINKYPLDYAESWNKYYNGEKLCLGSLISNFSFKNSIRQGWKKRNKFHITSQNITQMHTIIQGVRIRYVFLEIPFKGINN